MATVGEAAPLASRFWADIRDINRVVSAELVKPGAKLWELPLAIRGAIGSGYPAMIKRILAYAVELLDVPRMADSGRRSGSANAQMERFLQGCDRVLGEHEQRALSPVDRRTRRDELLMEHLTAAWLGLYFLGLPFIHPWEKVRRLADYRGGFPSGGCIAKYIGDVYRLARHWMAQQGPGSAQATLFPEEDGKSAAILVLSYTPLVLLREALTYHDSTYVTPGSVHELGRHYALLQMLLYLRCGYPVHFLVPVAGLAQSLDTLSGIPDDPASPPTPEMRARRTIIREGIRPWLFDTMFARRFPEQSVRLLKFPLDASGMPTCILGTRTGIYTLESGENGLHFAGNEIREALLVSYRDKLERLLGLTGSARVVSLLDLGPDFDDTLAALLPNP
ncbi:hypothetical protein G4G28_22805 [Massilia sp. Dwa41.01b]|uniref:hypothetical protein n=1 Tax=unclassified Massilia TaxID=2609279 RepID=UPI0015FFEAFD|nr:MULTISPECIES: hypothetical protein [unclassified Massilia]QNA90631.1 hypothetical protein G4G28_22805 [Massilia sp. Dwa41.01b]QNA97861.1 hypothetical protein G4G31_01875 [Massilia sp. Se16.2.3]